MKHFKTISAYCQGIQISPPKHLHFDIRSFEENMPTVVHTMSPFRHEFYAIALKVEGRGKAVSGHFTEFPKGATVFFNSPFQILSWDILPDWSGFYIMFSQDFIAHSTYFSDLLGKYPFLKLDKAMPIELEEQDLQKVLNIYKEIWEEYHGANSDRFQLIESYTLLLLDYVKRFFLRQSDAKQIESDIRTANLKILSRYQTLIQTSFYPNAKIETHARLHSTSYYAEKLNVHPNHLNAVVKEISGLTALSFIHNHLLQLAKSYLAQTELSVKEIAYSLYFDSPNNFSSFFKKRTGLTPSGYRQQLIL